MSSAFWYFSRASGLVSLVLFTVVVVLGALGAGRFATRGWPRFTVAALHRNLALTSLAFLAAHIASAVIDGYVPLAWLDVVIPFGSAYQPFWVGLGAVAMDLLLAIVVTSLLRTRIPPRAWRTVHWLAYLCWPVALVHGIGMAEADSAHGLIIGLDVLCGLAALGAIVFRVFAADPRHRSSQAFPVTEVNPMNPGTLPPHRLGLSAHRHRHGEIPWGALHGVEGRRRLIAAVAAAELHGRGGGGFPTAVKLAAVTGRRAIVVANGCEGDPLSVKDRTLLALAPHLVLEGVQVAAHAVGAAEAVLCLHEESPVRDGLAAALAERADRVSVRIAEIPRRYVASEESALVHFLNTGDARPTGKTPRPAERGVRGRPTLVGNVDTLAQLALVARLGPEAYRETRTDLVTVTGAVRRSGVVEARPGTAIGALLAGGGGEAGPLQAVLVGGYGGSWLSWPDAATVPFTPEGLRAAGATPGIPSIFALGTADCGLEYTAKVLAFLAAESARQCGPCMFGLPAIAADFAELVRGGDATGRLARRLPLLIGRGACAHPDGAARLAASALRVFHRDVAAHLAGARCRTLAGVA